ncbi:hypothetical protein IRY55_01740 [Savagea sp. SN6]|uniref:Uncharacterized protein n=1 Tax=Savagea serpentis TaxID=2785297 RepID=A0A8J7G909_9BACL|nr:hypothetical protein [Savagea serpentis]MBF4500070.1 hypothetical protein [Savagea serpentis]
MKRILQLFLATFMLVMLAACGGGVQESPESLRTPYDDQIELMQRAVDQYREKTGGLLPIKTRESDTDIYIKYPIEFSNIVPQYTEKIPMNAYEKGGVFQYVIYDAEDNPRVKLVDIRAAERIRELNLRKQVNGKVPFGDEIAPNVYKIDFDAMGFKKPLTVPSPYSQSQLPLVVAGNGQFYVDYSIDLANELSNTKLNVQKEEDIRYILAEASNVLPAYSLPYRLNEAGEPVMHYEITPRTSEEKAEN